MKKNSGLHRSGEDYLEAILIITARKGEARSVDIAEFLEVTRPSVCNAVAGLCDGGYLTVNADHTLALTDRGRAVAEEIYERHCFFTSLLEASGVDHKTAETDACEMEHAISALSFRQLRKACRDWDPHPDAGDRE